MWATLPLDTMPVYHWLTSSTVPAGAGLQPSERWQWRPERFLPTIPPERLHTSMPRVCSDWPWAHFLLGRRFDDGTTGASVVASQSKACCKCNRFTQFKRRKRCFFFFLFFKISMWNEDQRKTISAYTNCNIHRQNFKCTKEKQLVPNTSCNIIYQQHF